VLGKGKQKRQQYTAAALKGAYSIAAWRINRDTRLVSTTNQHVPLDTDDGGAIGVMRFLLDSFRKLFAIGSMLERVIFLNNVACNPSMRCSPWITFNGALASVDWAWNNVTGWEGIGSFSE
jgi:hypothetical protein